MWLGAVLLSAVSGATPLKVVATTWQFTNMERERGEVYQERFLTLLSGKTGLEVVTQKDLAAVLGLERQKALLGCEQDSAECSAELSSALGADVVLSGSLAKTETSFVVTVRGVNAKTGRAFAAASGRLTTEDALFNWLESEAGDFAQRMRESFDAWVESKTTPQYSYQKWPWLVVGGGALVGVVGLALYGWSRVDLDTVRRTAPAATDPLIGAGQTKQDLGVSLAIAGGVVAATGFTLLFATRSSTSTVAFVPGPGGGQLSWSGTW